MNLTLAYIIFVIVLLHVVAGFAWVIVRFTAKPKTKNQTNEVDTDAKKTND